MNRNNRIHRQRMGCFVACLIALAMSSCQTPLEQYKEEIDEFSYSAIEKKWDEKFGIKANYKMKDAEGAEPNVLPEQAIGSDGILTIPEAMLLATSNSRAYQLEKENLYAKALDLRLVRHLYEPNPFGTASSIYTDTEDTSNLTTSGALGFNQLLSTGGTISAKIGESWVEILSGDLRSGLTRLFSAAIEQPLLRGAGREAAMERLTQAEQDLLYEVRAFNHFRRDFIVDVIRQYFSILELYEKMKIAEDNVNRLDTIHSKTADLKKVGKVASHELEEIEQERMIARDELILATNEYKQFLDEFKLILAIPPHLEFLLDPNEFSAIRTLEPDQLGFTEQEAFDTAVALRLDLANASDRIIDSERKVRVAADKTRPKLNLVGSVNQQRATDNTHTGTYSGGAALDLGLDRTVEKTEYRRAMVTLEQSRRTFDELRDTVLLDIRSSLRKLREAHERYGLQMRASDKADQRLENTLLLLHYSRANTRDVLRAQQDAYDARNAATDAVIDYAIATLEFYRDTGVLQVKPDGMWHVGNLQAKSVASPDAEVKSPASVSLSRNDNSYEPSRSVGATPHIMDGFSDAIPSSRRPESARSSPARELP